MVLSIVTVMDFLLHVYKLFFRRRQQLVCSSLTNSFDFQILARFRTNIIPFGANCLSVNLRYEMLLKGQGRDWLDAHLLDHFMYQYIIIISNQTLPSTGVVWMVIL